MDKDRVAKMIEAMPDDAEFYLARDMASIGKTLQGFGNNGMITDLKQMAKFWLMRDEILEAVQFAAAERSEFDHLPGEIQALATE